MDPKSEGLLQLESEVRDQLSIINYPHPNWVQSKEGILDVAIIGAGMAGIAAAFALLRQGVNTMMLFDGRSKGFEGPWINYARMRTLRSGKELTGPSLEFPSLTFHAWYCAQWGRESWDSFRKAPNSLWMNYLRWVTDVLDLNVQSNYFVESIGRDDNGISLLVHHKEERFVLWTRKVILATGREGFGGARIPDDFLKIPKQLWGHTNESLDFHAFEGKRLAIIGAGASAFDAAAVALECGAHSVDMLVRRDNLPNVNKMAHMIYPGYNEGYYLLQDDQKLEIMHEVWKNGTPPPVEALERVKVFSNFSLHLACGWKTVQVVDNAIELVTDKFTRKFDYVLLATGFCIDGEKQPELKHLMPYIKLWNDQEVGRKDLLYCASSYPYLGKSFQFQPKQAGIADWLKNIYCFNFAATASQGVVSSDIPGIGAGAQRLARGIVADFFLEDYPTHLRNLQAYDKHEFFTFDQLYPS